MIVPLLLTCACVVLRVVVSRLEVSRRQQQQQQCTTVPLRHVVHTSCCMSRFVWYTLSCTTPSTVGTSTANSLSVEELYKELATARTSTHGTRNQTHVAVLTRAGRCLKHHCEKEEKSAPAPQEPRPKRNTHPLYLLTTMKHRGCKGEGTLSPQRRITDGDSSAHAWRIHTTDALAIHTSRLCSPHGAHTDGTPTTAVPAHHRLDTSGSSTTP